MLNKIFRFYVIAILCLSFLTSIPIQASQVVLERNIIKGLNYCYNFKWREAEKVFTDLIKKYPADPRGYNYLSSVYLWYYLGSNSDSDFDRFIQYSDSTIDKGIEYLDKHSEDDLILYIVGSNYSYRAIAFTKAENFLDAAWASKKSESYLNDALEINPKRNDAYLGLGLYNFAVGQIPSAFKWALSLAGIDGDIETGLSYIKKTADEGRFAKVEAQYYLSQILSDFLIRYDTASKYLKMLNKSYPDNLLFNYSAGVLELKKRNLDKAEKLLSKISKKDDPRFKQIISFSNFLMGDILFRKNKYDTAKVFYLKFLNSAPENDYAGIATYRLALCHEFTGDRENAQFFFGLTNEGNMDIEDDIFAKRKGEIYAERPLTENEKKVLVYNNLVESGKYKAAYDSLLALVRDSTSERIKAEASLLLSEACYYLGMMDESIYFAETIGGFAVKDEKWIKPYAAFYLARAYKKLNNQEEVEKYLDIAESYSDYDYQKKLKNHIYSLRFKQK